MSKYLIYKILRFFISIILKNIRKTFKHFCVEMRFGNVSLLSKNHF